MGSREYTVLRSPHLSLELTERSRPTRVFSEDDSAREFTADDFELAPHYADEHDAQETQLCGYGEAAG